MSIGIVLTQYGITLWALVKDATYCLCPYYINFNYMRMSALHYNGAGYVVYKMSVILCGHQDSILLRPSR